MKRGFSGKRRSVQPFPRRALFVLIHGLGLGLGLGIVLVTSATTFAAVDPPVAVSDRLDRICRYLEEKSPNQRAAARRQLREDVGAPDLEGLRAYLERRLPPSSLQALRHRFEELLVLRLEEVEGHILAFEGARILARTQAEEDRQESTPDTRDRLQQSRATRNEARRYAHSGFDFLREMGIPLAPVLWRRIEAGGNASPGILRFRDRLQTNLIETARKELPAAPATGVLSPFVERALVPLAHPLADDDRPGWSSFRQRVMARATEHLGSFHPDRRREGRSLLLELGDWAAEPLEGWVRDGDDSIVPASLRTRYHDWNRLAVPVGFVEETGLDPASYEGLPVQRRQEMLYRLEWVGGDRAIPIFARLMRVEPDISLKVECAAALARLRDPRGSEFLRQLGLGAALALETISRDVLLIEALHRRTNGDLQGALDDLQALLRQFPPSFRVHYEIGLTALQLRRLELSIRHFEKALALQADDNLAHYNLACAYALHGDPEPALKHLELSIAAGFADGRHMGTDPDLESLRELPGFQELIERIGG